MRVVRDNQIGSVFVLALIVVPPGEPERERDKLCPECASLPASPEE